MLATSREPLGVGGEQVWPVPPLPVDEATVPVRRAGRIEPPRLPSTSPTDDGVVAEICRRLDGLPLAIELAAARIRAMSPAEVADRLEDAQLLAGGPRHAEPRHQSLTAAIDWSYRLLSGPEQQMFARLSVFSGGADLAAVHAVCAEPCTSESETLDLLTALLDKSLVTANSAPGGTRYQMLETLRSYGQQHCRTTASWGAGTRTTTSGWPSWPLAACWARTSGGGGTRPGPTTRTCGRPSNGRSPTATPTSPSGWSVRCPR